MRHIKLLLTIIITGTLFTACTVVNNGNHIIDDGINLNQLISDYDLWYVDVHRSNNNADIPFMQKAFTVSFLNGTMYANNNIVDIGKTGNGLGITVGNYDTYNGVLETGHRLDGNYDFDVVQLSANEIRIDYIQKNISYYLIGYQKNNFDYDKLFYENIEYYLQEYAAWERVKASGGIPNQFDKETFLQFTPENNTTFYSSQDPFGTDIDMINWKFIGSYIIKDVASVEDLKYLTLNYENGDTEEFDLTVINDEVVRLYNIDSKTTYDFSGVGFIKYLKGGVKKAKSAVRNSNRKRTKIKRETVIKRN